MTHPRVLIADDHRMMLKTVTSLLVPRFEVVGTASNGAELISEAMRLQPDMVITDITMPVLNGIDAVHELRGKGCSAKFIFLTVHHDTEVLSACLAEGAMGYVVKSRMNKELIAAIDGALAGQRFVSPGIARSHGHAQ